MNGKTTIRRLAAFLALAVFLLTAAPGLAAEVKASSLRDDGRIRVWLRSLSDERTLTLGFNGIYAAGDGRIAFERGTVATLTCSDDSLYLSSGSLRLKLGDSVTFTRYQAAEGSANGLLIQENTSGGLYCGDLTVDLYEGAMRAILTVDAEEYLYGVVGYEMSDSWPLEALKAQSVAARTYAMSKKAQSAGREYDVADTTADQVYRGYQSAYANVIAAVDATEGVTGIWKGGYATCFYTASNGGQTALPTDVWTDQGDYGYLDRRDDPYDWENPMSVVKSVEFRADLSDCPALRTLLTDAVDEALDRPFTLQRVLWITPVDPVPEDSRRYTRLRFEVSCLTEKVLQTPAPTEEGVSFPAVPFAEAGQQEERTVTVDLDVFGQIKSALELGINGSDYELIQVLSGQGSFTLETRRFGHGVGMSQRGAQRMAGHYGMDWTEILGFYYPGMSLEKISWSRPALEALEGISDTAPAPSPTPAPLPELSEGEYYAKVVLHGDSDALNIRKGPSTGTAVLDRFEEGRRVIVSSPEDENGWVKIRTAELNGYVKAYYLEAE